MSTAVEIPEAPPEAPPEAQLYVEPETDGIISWTEFTENTTFHGVKNVFQKTNITLRRPVWLVVVVVSLLVFVVQVSVRVGDFFQYKTFVDVGITYNSSLQFPAVTICNQNTFRMTATAELDLYDVIDGVFKEANISKIPWNDFTDKVNGIDYEKFLNTTGHQKLLFIDSCEWNGEDCNIDSNFKAVLTDLGLCYTLNTKNKGVDLQTTETGADAGLKLVLNVEQYEYMRGPQNDAGVMILLHPAGEIPIMGEHGFAAAPGSHTLVAIKRSELETLMPPYGLCHPSNIPISQCHAQCRGTEIINSCGCHAVHIPSPSDNVTVACNFKSSLFCARKALAEMKKSKSTCICNPPCLQVKYEPELSYAQLSKFNIDRTILDNPEKQEKLQERYTMARETAHRYIEELRARDELLMQRVVNKEHAVSTIVKSNVEKVKNPLAAAQHFNLPPIFLLEPIQTDFRIIERQVSQAHWKVNGTFFESYNNLLLHLKYTISEFEVGSVFNGLLGSCMDMADEARLHINDTVALTQEENVTLKYGSQACMEDIGHRVEVINTQRDSCEFHLNDLSNFIQGLAEYQSFLHGFFENTDKTADGNADHISCLQFWESGDTLVPRFSEIFSYIDAFITAQNVTMYKSTADNIQATTQNSIIKDAVFNLSLCDWPDDIFLKTTKDFQYLKSFNNVKLKEAHTNVLRGFESLTAAMEGFNRGFDQLVVPIVNKIADYIDHTAEMAEVASLIGGVKGIKKLIVDMEAFRTNAYTMIKNVEDKLDQYRFNLEPLYTFAGKTAFPVMTTEQIQNLQFFKEIAATKRSNYVELLNGISVNASLSIEQLFEMVFEGYKKDLSDVVNTVVNPLQELIFYLTELQAEMVVFQESITLNVNFFMENFLQVDIFYRDMSYEVISQQMAFGPLSLLGEIGGFMGLLLGASVITVCELLDYVFINIIRVCIHKHRMKTKRIEVTPASVSVQSVKT